MGNLIRTSEDGSKTLFSEKFGVTYHSIYGAINESITVFLSAGLQYQVLKGKRDISILEMGFGTGLNAFLTFLESERNQPLQVAYTGIELYPIAEDLVSNLAYPDILHASHHRGIFMEMHRSDAGQKTMLNNLTFQKIYGSILEIDLPESYDVIYYDAFAPTAQEELWTPELMQKLYNHTTPGGVLVTYCAKGSFKRALRSAGYQIEALPGPPGKREMTRAIKPAEVEVLS